MIGLVGFMLVASGVAGLASAFYLTSFAYGIKLELSYVLYALWIAIGAGLWRRRESARVLALGLFLAGSWTVLIVIGYIALHRNEVGSALGFLLYVAIRLSERMPNAAAAIPIAIVAYVVLVLAGSLFSWWLYRYFKRSYVAEQFTDGATSPRTAVVFTIAIAYVAAIPFYSEGPTIQQASLPSWLQSKAYKDRRKAAADSQLRERASFLANLVGELHFGEDGASVVVASHATRPELFFLDAASGAAARKDPAVYRVDRTTNEPVALAAQLSADNRWFFSSDARQLVDTKSDQARAVGIPAGWIVPLGFGRDAATYLWCSPASAKLQAIELASDRILFSIDATRAEWLTDDFKKGELRYALRNGALSPSRSHFAYVFNGRLHLLSLPEGVLEIDERPVPPQSLPTFAREGNALILTVNGAVGTAPIPGVLYMLADKTLQPHAIRPPVFYFSSAEGRILSSGIDHIAEHSLQDLTNERRRIAWPQYASYAVTTDGRFLVVKARDKASAEFAELTTIPGEGPAFQPLPTKLANGQSWLRFSAGPGRLLVVSGARVELLASETLGREGAASQLYDLGRLSQDPRLSPKPGR